MNRTSFRRIYSVVTFALLALRANAAPAAAPSVATDQFEMFEVKAPKFKDLKINIAERGAVGDGVTTCTQAFADAIAEVSLSGGGHVIVPPGTWLSGPIALQSNVDLHLERGALVVFSPRYDLYASGGGPSRPLIGGEKLENIAITGEGILDGSGEPWRPLKKEKTTERQWKEAQAAIAGHEENGFWVPNDPLARRRPPLFLLNGCKRVLVEGVTFQNSPQFAVHPLHCEDMQFRHIIIHNEWWAQNGDGLDLGSCRNVLIEGVWITAGDDAICMKTDPGAPTENVLIRDSTVYHGHGGFVIGSQTNGGIHNVRVENCTFIGTDVGLRFKSARDRGNLIDKIDIVNTRMLNIPGEAIVFDMYYENQAPLDRNGDLHAPTEKAPAVTADTPRFQDIHFRGITCNGARSAVQLQGLPEMPLRRIALEDVKIVAQRGIMAMDVEEISMKNVQIENQTGPVLNFFNSKKVAVDGLNFRKAATLVEVQGTGNSDIVIKHAQVDAGIGNVKLTGGARADAVRFE